MNVPESKTRSHAKRAWGIAASGLMVAGLLTAVSATPALAARGAGGSGGASDACGTAIYKAQGGRWTCTFVDNFSGSALDGNKWVVGDTAKYGFSMANTCLTPDNVAVANGELRVTVKDMGAPFTCASPYGSFTTQYTGGHLGTNGHFAQTYGRFEVRARYPQTGPGVHGGFWMYPAKLTYGAWPASGELDVAEWWSNVPNTVLPSLIYNGSNYTDDSGWNCTVADPTVWHTYNVVWSSTQMVFSIDGVPCFTRSWTPTSPQTAPQPFDQPFNLVLSFAADGPTGPNATGPSTTLPATYEVDYVKAWS